MSKPAVHVPVNEIRLAGRLSGEAGEIELPSGDRLVTFRLVVPRPATRARPTSERRVPSVDTIDCVVKAPVLRRRVLGLSADTELQVDGALRRRFYRGPGGLGSRHEVEVTRLASRR